MFTSLTSLAEYWQRAPHSEAHEGTLWQSTMLSSPLMLLQWFVSEHSNAQSSPQMAPQLEDVPEHSRSQPLR